ncbi:vacuolar ATPase assembly integral membrane protein vma21 [Irineochytrium annulatum]|nr:vacuolar ATPase assembly integral membrane protein vma21 [Irineochytrium annulatum]
MSSSPSKEGARLRKTASTAAVESEPVGVKTRSAVAREKEARVSEIGEDEAVADVDSTSAVASEKKVKAKKVSVEQKAKTPGVRVDRSVVLKLAFFSILMFTLPIGTYLYTQQYVFDGNSTYSAIVAAVVANIVLIAYIVVAFLEDNGDDDEVDGKSKGEGVATGRTGDRITPPVKSRT